MKSSVSLCFRLFSLFFLHRSNKIASIRQAFLLLCLLTRENLEKVQEMTQIFKHVACRNGIYAKTIQRFNVPEDFISWSAIFEDYNPPNFESPVLQGKPWADSEITKFQPKFNELDGKVNRVSWTGVYKVDSGLPLNPFGRTGEYIECSLNHLVNFVF